MKYVILVNHHLTNDLKVEGEKTFHLRVAAIFGEIEAEVCSEPLFSCSCINQCISVKDDHCDFKLISRF